MTTVFTGLRAEGMRYADLKQQIATAFDLDDHDQALLDTVSGESNFRELCSLAIREAMMAENMADAVDAQIEKLKARKARFLHKCERLRQIVAEAMIEAGERKIVEADVTITVRDGKPKTSVADFDRLPDRYKVVVPTFKANMDAIRADCERGNVPEGVAISNAGPVLTVRVK